MFNYKYIKTTYINVNKIDKLQIKLKNDDMVVEFFKKKKHPQFEFENIGSKSNKFYKNFLSGDTTKPNEGFYENIGKINEYKDQFINFKHQLIVDKDSFGIIKYSNNEYCLNNSNKIDILLQQSNKIPIIEQKLNILQYNFETCVKYGYKVSDCYHIFNINSYKICNGLFDTFLTFNVV